MFTAAAAPTATPQPPADKKKRKREIPLSETTTAATTTFDEESEGPSSVLPGSLRVNGVVRAKAFLQFSDMRLKADINDLVDAVNIVSQLQGKSYVWKTDQESEEKGGKRVIGLIAQEVQKVLPQVVHQDENGFLSVAYAELVPVLIEAFKAQLRQYENDKELVHTQFEELRLKLEKMESKVKASLEQQMQEIGKNAFFAHNHITVFTMML